MTRRRKVRRMCAALDDAGKRCRRTDTELVQYFGDPDFKIASREPDWVLVWLCSRHRVEPRGSRDV